MADLISLNDYKELEGVTNTQHDARTEIIIDSVSSLVKTYCGNSIIDFYSANKVELVTIKYSTDFIQLTESPVNTIVSVKERDDVSSAYTTLVSTDFELEKTLILYIESLVHLLSIGLKELMQ